MKPTDNLLDTLAPTGVDHEELLGLLQRFFVTCAMEDNGDLLYPSGTQHSLKVQGVGGHVKRIETGPGLTPARLDELVRDIKTSLLESPGDAIGRVVAFSSPLSIRGSYFADGAQVQLLDAPPVAPRPETIFGSHPAVLEFRMSRSVDGMVTNQRRLRVGTEWTRVLNALLRIRLWTPSPRHQHHWVIDWEPDVNGLLRRIRSASHWVTRGRYPRSVGPKSSVKWLQEYYDYPGFAPISEAFSPAGELVKRVPHELYYSPTYRREGDVAELPDSLGKLLRAAATLSADHRERYLRAAAWLHAAPRMWDVHTSAWFISLVAAIESLMPPATERCPTCNAVRYVTRNFRDFVEKHAPTSDDGGRKAIYEMRSRLAHGSRLMELDDAPWSFGARMEAADEYSTVDHLVLVVRELMVNWLLEHSDVRPGQDTPHPT